jgi:hypothetical protein
MGEEDNNWILIADDASIGDMSNDHNMPSGDPPTDFEQAIFKQYMAPEDLHFLVTPTHAASTATCGVWK